MPDTGSDLVYIRNSDLITTEMDGDIVMMSIERGEYFGIGGVGSRVWELLEKPVTLPDITAIICAEFDVDQTTCQADMEQFLGELESHGLISQPSKA